MENLKAKASFGIGGIFLVTQVALSSVALGILFYLGYQSLYEKFILLFLSPFLPDQKETINYLGSLLLLLLLAASRSKVFGFTLGATLSEWRLFLICSVPVIVAELTYFGIGGRSPFSGLGWQYYILAPVCEEVLFRGILQSLATHRLSEHYSGKLSIRVGVVVSALAFSLAHILNVGGISIEFVLFQIGYAFIFGILFGFLRAKTNSILPSILLHAIINFIGVVLF